MRLAFSLVCLVGLSAPAWAGTIRLSSSDGVSLSAQAEGTGDRGIVLVHGKAEDHNAMAELTKAFSTSKNRVVAVDRRGYGKSGGQVDPLASVADVAAAVAYVRKQGATQVSIVGVGMGGNLALLAASMDPEIHDVVMISPALNHDGVKASAALEGFGDRPVLMIVGQGDTKGSKAAELLGDRMAGAQVERLPASGAGSKLIKQSTDLPTLILGWYGDMADREKAATGAAQTSPMGEDLKTTGKKLGER